MESDYTKSEFNDSLGYINRINSLFWLADKSSMEYNAQGWLSSLFTIFRELSTEIKSEDRDRIKKVIAECNCLVNKQLGSNGVSKRSEISSDLVFKLADLEIELRIIQDKAGLLVKRALDPNRALSGGG